MQYTWLKKPRACSTPESKFARCGHAGKCPEALGKMRTVTRLSA